MATTVKVGEVLQVTESDAAVKRKYPINLCCFICKEVCSVPVQIFCCNELFCEDHLKKEVITNFKCPACNKAASLNELVVNKQVATMIRWYNGIIEDVTGVTSTESKVQNNETSNNQVGQAQSKLELNNLSLEELNYDQIVKVQSALNKILEKSKLPESDTKTASDQRVDGKRSESKSVRSKKDEKPSTNNRKHKDRSSSSESSYRRRKKRERSPKRDRDRDRSYSDKKGRRRDRSPRRYKRSRSRH